MRGIIRQNPELPALPDLRNLGTILRILLAVNGGALIAAFAIEPRWSALADQFIDLSAVVEPHLLLELAVLWAIAPWLGRQRYAAGLAVVAAVTAAVAVVVHVVLARVLPDIGGLARHVALALAAAGIVAYYLHLRVKALSPAITEARLQALQARIRPHFLFNSINAVLSLIRSEPRRAETALEDMAELFRVLMRDNRELTPLEVEVNLCQQYLDLEKLRLGERLIVEWNLKSMPGDALVPPLVLQPLLENAVYHGIEPRSTPGVLSINVFLSKGEVHAIMKNPVLAEGRKHQTGNKMAIANIRERLALHFDAEASLESKVTKEHYEVHIRMPYRTTKPEVAADAANAAPKPGGNIASGAQRTRAAFRPQGVAGPIPT